MDEPHDQEMTNGQDNEGYLPLSSDEKKVLALYDRLQELRLEIAIINAQKAYRADTTSTGSEAEAATAQDELLQARARYKLQNDVVEAVMIANPILKAVHAGAGASPVDRDLLPYVERRDEASKSVAQQASDLGNLRHELTRVQSEALETTRRNVELAAEVFAMAEMVKQQKTGDVDDAQTRQALAQLETEVAGSQRRWRIIKGVASGMVAGSGVDWSQDDVLRDIVLDPREEIE
ncbi:centromere protein H (CENP-H)-domain-containing protein [Stachybotrys elegans]|uniref:Centromere protein H (CENP-H)-domain-containing protein n=1 Tax=Stachybotrys elegans TaxID=80388 RepID=A0A8K0WWP6_9HYPO|nr:centromere protein H (CENP-H)-domain-containing protein [Stachybotrys elegans]